MRITREAMKEIARKFLLVLRKEGISSLSDLIRRGNQRLPVDEDSIDHIQLASRPSEWGKGTVYMMTYRASKTAALEVKLDLKARYSTIKLVSSASFRGYERSGMGLDNNKIQRRTLDPSKKNYEIIPHMVKELEKLAA